MSKPNEFFVGVLILLVLVTLHRLGGLSQTAKSEPA